MKFDNEVFLSKKICLAFWREIESSYTIERMFEDYENARIRLEDKLGYVEFVLFKARKGKDNVIGILDKKDNYVGYLWKNEKGKIGGYAEGEHGVRRTIQSLTMLEKSIARGFIELEVFRNDLPDGKPLPLTDSEKAVADLLKEGFSFDEIEQTLSLYPEKMEKIKKNLVRKGVLEDTFEKLAS